MCVDRQFIVKKAKEWNVDVEVLAELKFAIPQMYKFHKKKSKDVAVDFIRFGIRDDSYVGEAVVHKAEKKVAERDRPPSRSGKRSSSARF